MAEWKKVVVSGSNISQLNNDANYVASTGAGIVSGSEQIDGANIANNTVSYGGVQVTLGGSDATPAFDLQDATGYTGDSNLVTLGTVTSGDVSAILPTGTVSGSGQIDGGSISSNTVGFGGVSVALGSSDSTPAFDLQDATGYTGDSNLVTVGTVTSGDVSAILPTGTVSGSGQIDGSSISSNTVGFGGISVALGSEDATPAFNLQDATSYPGDGNLVTVGTVTSGDVSAILPSGVVSGSGQISIGSTDGAGNVVGLNVGIGANNVLQATDSGNTLADNDFLRVAGTKIEGLTAAQMRDQLSLDTDDSVTFTNLTLSGNLTVSGDYITANVTNLAVDDKYILLNSGSTSGDSGIVFGGSKGNLNQGMALILDDSDDRLKIMNFETSGSEGSDIDFSGAATHLSVAGVFEGTDANATLAGADKVGNLRVESSEIYIYV